MGPSTQQRIVLVLVGLVLMLAVLNACSPQRAWEAMLVLEDVRRGPLPSQLDAVTQPPSRSSVEYSCHEGTCMADIYRGGTPAAAGLVLVPGVTDQGKDDPRVVVFADTLARAGFAVLVPEITGLRQFRVSAININDVESAFIYLRNNIGLASNRRAGIGAFSYAVGPAMLAALEPAIASDVDFFVAVGGYHDLNDALNYFTTGYYREQDRWQYQRPRDAAKWIFVLSNLDYLDNERERNLLQLMALRKLANAQADVSDLVRELGDQGLSVYALLNNTNPERTPRLLEQLPAGVRSTIAALTLADKPLEHLHGEVLLIHGLDDDMIPYTESIALSKALADQPHHLYLVDGLIHVDVEPGLLDSITLWRAVDRLLALRDMPRAAKSH